MRIITTVLCAMFLGTACSDPESTSAPATTPDGQSDVMMSADAVPDLSEGDDAIIVPDSPSEPDVEPLSCPAGVVEVVSFTTEDGVVLEADLHTTGVEASPAIVLLHMIPPGNDRSNYPLVFREQLNEAGFTVLNVDRRGAGGSQGVASEAYDGPNGKLDAAAAIEALAALPCPPDLSRLALVGASNGTTTALDYTVHASAQPDHPDPSALVFLTGGGYTENQHHLSDVLDVVAATPILFVFPANESAWSQGYAGVSESWTHSEYEPSGHGTHLFDSAPESMTDVVEWLGAAL
jgi:pimeloyl-ACP methyl ester carboxylesterase